MSSITISDKEVDKASIVIDGVDTRDYPDLCDAYASEAKFADGTELNDVELEELDAQYPEIIHELAHESLH